MNIQLLVSALGLTVNSFEKAIGVTQSRISKIIKRNSDISHDIINKILSKFPEVSSGWLLNGEGEMFVAPVRRLKEVIEALNITPEQIKFDSGFDLTTIYDSLKASKWNSDSILKFTKSYNINISWLINGFAPFSYDPKVNELLIENKKRKIKTLEKRMNELRTMEGTYSSAVNYDEDKLHDIIHESDELSSDLANLYDELNAEYEVERNRERAGDNILGEDIFLLEYHAKSSKLINMGRNERAISIPYLHTYYLNAYPAQRNDKDFIKDLPRLVFRVPGSIPRKEMLAIQMDDDSMDDGTKNSVLSGDIVVGSLWNNKSRLLDGNAIDRTNLNFIIVTSEMVICRNHKFTDRKANQITYAALNNEYPDVTFDMDDILELYMVGRIERNKLMGVPSIFE